MSPTPPAEAWTRDPEVLERVFHAAVGEGDADSVECVIRLMLAVDVRRGVEMYESLKAGLRVVDLLSVAAGTADEAAIRRALR